MHPGLSPSSLGTKSSISSDALSPKEPNIIVLRIKGPTQHGAGHLMWLFFHGVVRGHRQQSGWFQRNSLSGNGGSWLDPPSSAGVAS